MRHLLFLFTTLTLAACQPAEKSTTTAVKKDIEEIPVPDFQNQAHELVYNMVQTVGTYEDLKALHDVTYTYHYELPDGKADVTIEKYIFDGELSYANYQQRDRTFPDLEGKVEQGYDGTSFWVKNNGEVLNDEAKIKRARFSRKTNFYWFAMMQKLVDPGLNYAYVDSTQMDGRTYDIVKVSFNSEQPTDIYQLYINRKTKLVDQFLFTVADFNVMETPFLMRVEYETINGIQVPSQRKYTKANWEGEPQDDNWVTVRWSDIHFNTGLSKADFEA